MNREKSIQLYQGFQPKYAHKSDRIAVPYRVPEVWMFKGNVLSIYQLDGDGQFKSEVHHL